MRPIRSILLTPVLALVLAAPLAATAQTTPNAQAAPAGQGPAAASLPNTFDRPQAAASPRPAPRRASPASASGPASAQTPVPATPSDPAKVAAAEAMLRTTVAAMQAGAPNYGDMTSDLAIKVREQAATISPLIKSFGALQSVAHVGAENGAELFLVGFANQATQWIIAQNAEGKIVALLFRPAAEMPAPSGN